jgi:hypothetical protein
VIPVAKHASAYPDDFPNTATASELAGVLFGLAISDPKVVDRLAAAESNARLN